MRLEKLQVYTSTNEPVDLTISIAFGWTGLRNSLGEISLARTRLPVLSRGEFGAERDRSALLFSSPVELMSTDGPC